MAPRGRGGKFSKPTRGGGKHFSRDIQPLDKDGNPIGMWRDPDEEPSSEEEEDSESEEESSEDEDEAGPSQVSQQDMTREQRRAAAKAKKEAAAAKRSQVAAQPGDLPPSDSEEESDGELPANPNHTAKSRSQAANVPSAAAPAEKVKAKDPSELSRREREAIQAQQARERYMKLHMEGKTDEARADLERLAIIREKREVEKARKEAEREEKDARDRERAEQISEREKKLREAAVGRGGRGKRGAKK